MPAARRKIVSNRLYEVEFRTREGLPFPALRLIRLLLASAMARAQRDHKVIISHSHWMANHPHMLLRVKDAAQCARFYSEVMKKVTDYMKRLLGFEHLELWEPGGPVVSEVLDLEGAVERIAYIYANPAAADLVETIDDYPGFSSWSLYRSNPNAAEHSEIVPWVRQPTIPKLSCRRIEERQDKILTDRLVEKNKRHCHALTFCPNAIWEAFGITDPEEIGRYNQAVFTAVARREAEHAERRRITGKTVLGAARLKSEPIFKEHTPKRDSTNRKVLFHTTLKKLALQYLDEYRAFCNECRDAYLAWKSGKYDISWPPGAFRPPLGPMANALA